MSSPRTTGRRAAEGDELLDAILEALPGGVVAVEPGGRIVRVNAAAEHVFGYRRDQMEGEPFELLLAEDVMARRDQLREYVHDLGTWPYATVTECTGRRRDGAEIRLDITLSPLDFGDGIGMLATIQEATTRQQVGERLAVLEAFVETSEDAVFSHDADGRITGWNRSSERIFGYPKDEILGQRTTVLFPEHLQAEAKLVFDTVAAGDRVDRFQTEIQRKDGMPIPISLSVRPLFEGAGTPTSSVLIARDVTEQRLAQATLAEIETRIREAEALAHVGSWLWDIRTGAVQWTDELHRIHGIDPLDFEGTLAAHLAGVHPDERERVRARLEDAVASGRPFEDEYRVVRPNGQHRWVYARAEPTVGSAGAVVGLRGIGQDVTERRASPSPRSHPGRP